MLIFLHSCFCQLILSLEDGSTLFTGREFNFCSFTTSRETIVDDGDIHFYGFRVSDWYVLLTEFLLI